MLGSFEAEVVLGLHHNSRLIVERIDRLSRQGETETLDLIRKFIENGITVCVAEDREIFEAGKKMDAMKIMKTVLKASVATEESNKKSSRIKDKYRIRREAAKGSGLVCGILPAWLRKTADGRAELIAERAEVVRKVFELADRGLGSREITRYLNQHYAPWPNRNGSDANHWTRPRITRMLVDRAVTGEYQPYTREVQPDGSKLLVAVGEAWVGHYPRVINQALFDRVQAAKNQRKNPAGAKSVMVSNLFSGLLRCENCGGPVSYQLKRKAGQEYGRVRADGTRLKLAHDDARLICDRGHLKGDCSNATPIQYHGFERAMLDACLHLALDDRAFRSDETLRRLTSQRAEMGRAHQVAVEAAGKLWDAVAATGSQMATDRALEAEANADVIAGELRTLEHAIATANGLATAEQHLSRVGEFRQHVYSDDGEVRREHRRKVQQGFRAIVKSMLCQQDGSVAVTIAGGIIAFNVARGRIVGLNETQSMAGIMANRFDSFHARDNSDVEAIIKRVA